MNISQANLYEVLDAFMIDATVGKNHFEIDSDMHLDNGYVDVKLRVRGLHVHESETALYAIMAIGDLGIIGIAQGGEFKKVCLFDFAHPTPDSYARRYDWVALLTHLSEDKWHNEFVVEYIVC